MIWRTAPPLWAGRLSITTISPGARVGTRHCRRYSVKIARVMARSMTNGAVMPSWRKPARKVRIFQLPPRHPADNPAAAFGAPAQPRHVGGGAGLVDEHQPRRIEVGLRGDPGGSRCGDVRPLLLAGVHDFFEADALGG